MSPPTRLMGQTDLPAPIEDRWFEDYVPGASTSSGRCR